MDCAVGYVNRFILSFSTNTAAPNFAEERAVLKSKRKECEAMHLHLQVSVATEKNFTAHQGLNVAPLTKDAE